MSFTPKGFVNICSRGDLRACQFYWSMAMQDTEGNRDACQTPQAATLTPRPKAHFSPTLTPLYQATSTEESDASPPEVVHTMPVRTPSAEDNVPDHSNTAAQAEQTPRADSHLPRHSPPAPPKSQEKTSKQCCHCVLQ